MPTVGAGVREIRIRTGWHFRVVYAARCAEAVYVLHAFEKRTRKTTRADLQLARDRWRRLTAERDRGTSP